MTRLSNYHNIYWKSKRLQQIFKKKSQTFQETGQRAENICGSKAKIRYIQKKKIRMSQNFPERNACAHARNFCLWCHACDKKFKGEIVHRKTFAKNAHDFFWLTL